MNIFHRIKTLAAGWYRGRYVSPDNQPGAPYLPVSDYERHWTAMILSVVATFLATHWISLAIIFATLLGAVGTWALFFKQ